MLSKHELVIIRHRTDEGIEIEIKHPASGCVISSAYDPSDNCQEHSFINELIEGLTEMVIELHTAH